MVTGDGPEVMTECLKNLPEKQIIYRRLFTKLGKIHNLISANRFLDTKEIKQLRINCENFGMFWSLNFANCTITPKVKLNRLLLKHLLL